MLFVEVEVVLVVEIIDYIDIFEGDVCVDVYCFSGFGG